jgi:hypothetical protein
MYTGETVMTLAMAFANVISISFEPSFRCVLEATLQETKALSALWEPCEVALL